ncbi:hypothetical protein [Nostoc sp. 'Lobaria pulmonaria (5183) cyanobiont']|uniref:hypothetical protein n=1 Tax=Nostoc sp. 'Lobaria pulmonaria (5183) cyanobiont' TaxID=1618022 RepID=UPI001319C866|nr:hypothetical protein [Nostoc sp. 'Lobaria pulmonaria (5183) cyanobiont']
MWRPGSIISLRKHPSVTICTIAHLPPDFCYTYLVKGGIDAPKSSRFIDVYSDRLTLPSEVVSHAHLIVTSLEPLPP